MATEGKTFHVEGFEGMEFMGNMDEYASGGTGEKTPYHTTLIHHIIHHTPHTTPYTVHYPSYIFTIDLISKAHLNDI